MSNDPNATLDPDPSTPASPARIAAMARSILLAHCGPYASGAAMAELKLAVAKLPQGDWEALDAELDRLVGLLNEGDAV